MPYRTEFGSYGTLRIRGLTEMSRKLKKLAEEYPKMVAAASFTELNIEKKESMRRTPVDSGALRDSHKVIEPEIRGTQIMTGISVGDWNVNNRGEVTNQYAIPVHEDIFAEHMEGQAKFLESTLRESERFMLARIGRRVEMRLRAVGAK